MGAINNSYLKVGKLPAYIYLMELSPFFGLNVEYENGKGNPIITRNRQRSKDYKCRERASLYWFKRSLTNGTYSSIEGGFSYSKEQAEECVELMDRYGEKQFKGICEMIAKYKDRNDLRDSRTWMKDCKQRTRLDIVLGRTPMNDIDNPWCN